MGSFLRKFKLLRLLGIFCITFSPMNYWFVLLEENGVHLTKKCTSYFEWSSTCRSPIRPWRLWSEGTSGAGLWEFQSAGGPRGWEAAPPLARAPAQHPLLVQGVCRRCALSCSILKQTLNSEAGTGAGDLKGVKWWGLRVTDRILLSCYFGRGKILSVVFFQSMWSFASKPLTQPFLWYFAFKEETQKLKICWAGHSLCCYSSSYKEKKTDPKVTYCSLLPSCTTYWSCQHCVVFA